MAYAMHEPADGKCYVGVIGNSEARFDDWINQTGLAKAAVGGWYNGGFLADNTGGTFGTALAITVAHTPGPVAIHWSFRCLKNTYGDTTRGNLVRMKNGESDAFIITQLANLRAPGRPVFLRWGWEMNGSWGNSNWSWLYHDSNDAHNALSTPTDYIAAFRRLALITRGGTRASINSALSGLGLPNLADGGSGDLPTGQIAMVWCPNTGPNPNGAPHDVDNHPDRYWPGFDYVDWVGLDTYSGHWTDWSQGLNLSGGLQGIYDTYSTGVNARPCGLWEVGNIGGDVNGVTPNPNDATKGPAFATGMFDWIDSHPKAKYINWFASNTGGDLPSQNPNTMNVWGARVSADPGRYIIDPTLVATASDVSPPPFPPRGRPKW